MTWTDGELEAEQWKLEKFIADPRTLVRGEAERACDLYRLARLGLAAEQVGQEGFAQISNGDLGNPSPLECDAYDVFISHPAWRTP